MKAIKILIILTASLLLWAPSASGAGAKLEQKLDSAYILMGKTSTINVELIKTGTTPGNLVIQDGAYPAEVELHPGDGDTTDLGGDRWQIRRRLVIQSFDSGLYTLPPILYIEGGDTIASGTLALKVVPVDVDSLKDIHDYAPVYDAGSKWYDSLPDWLVDYWYWILLALLSAGAAIWYYVVRHKKPQQTEVKTPKVVVPPYELAIQRLEELRSEHLPENGREREYYTRLTEILRIYLQDRFGINAMEMTSGQILHALESNSETRMSRPAMNQILEMADFVKFAKVRPLPDDNVKVFNAAIKFVEATKPLPPAPAEAAQQPLNNPPK